MVFTCQFQLKKEFSVSGSEEEEDAEDSPHVPEDSDEDLTDFGNNGMNDDDEVKTKRVEFFSFVKHKHTSIRRKRRRRVLFKC